MQPAFIRVFSNTWSENRVSSGVVKIYISPPGAESKRGGLNDNLFINLVPLWTDVLQGPFVFLIYAMSGTFHVNVERIVFICLRVNSILNYNTSSITKNNVKY